MNLKFLQNKAIKNAGWLISEQIFQMLLSLVVGVLTARYLGPSNYGALNYTASFVSFVMAIATLGMEGVVIKKMIAKPDDEGIYLGSCMFFRLISSMLCMMAVILLVYVLNPNEELKVLLVGLQSLQLAFRSVHILDSWFQRHLKSKYVSIGKMVAAIVVAAYKVFLLITSKSIVWFAVSNTLTDLVIAIMLYLFYRWNHAQKLRVSFPVGKEVLGESYHFVLSGLVTAIYGQMDRIMIGQMLTDEAVGLYTTALALCGIWIFVPTAIINSFRPKIMELKENGQEELYKLRLTQLYSFVIWLCFAVALVIAVLGRFAILILYGDAYLGAVSSLKIAVWFEAFSMIGTARGIWVLCENKNKYVKYYLGIGAVVNLVLNAILIPLMGIDGAALATLVTQVVTAVVAPALFKETRAHTKIVWDAFICRWWFERKKYENKGNIEEE